MLKWAAIAAATLALLLVLAFAAVAWLVDPGEIAALIETRIEEATGADATLGPVGFALLPMPELRLQGLELRERRRAREIASAREIRVGVSLLSALLGRVVLSGVDLDEPRLRLELGPDGKPVLPFPTGSEDAPSGAPRIVVRSLRIENGTVELGPWTARGIYLSGALGADLTLGFAGRLEVEGIGRLEDQDVRVSGLVAGPLRIAWSGTLVDLDLPALGARLDRADVEAGRLAGHYRLEVEDGAPQSLEADLLARGLRVRGDAFAVEGDVPLRARPGERWRLELDAARVSVGEALRKPAGGELALSGALPARDLRLHVAGSELPLRLTDGGAELGPGELALEGISSWIDRDVSGAVEIAKLRAARRPGGADLELDGGGALRGVTLQLPEGELTLQGPWLLDSRALRLPEVTVGIAGQQLSAAFEYALASGRIAARSSASDVQLEPILIATRGRAELTGLLGLDARFEGVPDPQVLTGAGSFQLRDGELRGFSILEQVLGELAKVPVLLAAAKGRDLSKFDEERFESISAEYTLQRGQVHVNPLVARYRSGTATLRGTVRLEDGALDLRGRVELAREVDEELTGEAPKRPTVIPIEGVRGTVARPRVVIDRDALAGVAATMATRGKLGRQLEDRLGPGGAEAVQQIFDQLLRGGRKPDKDPPGEQSGEQQGEKGSE